MIFDTLLRSLKRQNPECQFRLRLLPCSPGFTLIELIIVVAIIGVLTAIAIPYYQGYVAAARNATVMTNLQMLSREIDGFFILNDRYPDDLDELGLGEVKDPWGNPFQYLNIQTVKGKGKLRKDHSLVPVNTDYDLYSMGPDGDSKSPFTAKASRDDIVRANNGKYFGTVSDY